MIEVDFDDVVEATVVHALKESIAMLEEQLEKDDRFAIWFHNRDKDIAATKHLIHCMKVVADWYTVPSEGFYFDYTVTEVPNEALGNS